MQGARTVRRGPRAPIHRDPGLTWLSRMLLQRRRKSTRDSQLTYAARYHTWIAVKEGRRLSIVIPAYNEAERIGPTLDHVLGWAAEHHPGTEVLVVDDGSSDSTCDLIRSYGPNVRLVENGRNRGKGYSVKHGVMEATGDRILFSDADLSTPIEEYERLASALDSGNYDVAIGSRGLPNSNIVVRQPAYRQAMGKTFNQIVRVMAVSGISDTQCGFKLFTARAAKDLFSRTTTEGFAFDVEVLMLAQAAGYRIAEVPVTWVNDERTHVHAVYDSLRMLKDVAKMRVRHMLQRSS